MEKYKKKLLHVEVAIELSYRRWSYILSLWFVKYVLFWHIVVIYQPWCAIEQNDTTFRFESISCVPAQVCESLTSLSSHQHIARDMINVSGDIISIHGRHVFAHCNHTYTHTFVSIRGLFPSRRRRLWCVQRN